jgi:hypothetical protein
MAIRTWLMMWLMEVEVGGGGESVADVLGTDLS